MPIAYRRLATDNCPANGAQPAVCGATFFLLIQGAGTLRQEFHIGPAILDRGVRERPAPLDETPEQEPLGLAFIRGARRWRTRPGIDPRDDRRPVILGIDECLGLQLAVRTSTAVVGALPAGLGPVDVPGRRTDQPRHGRGDRPALDGAERRDVSPPVLPLRTPALHVAERHGAGGDEPGRGGVVEPAGQAVARVGRRLRHPLELAQKRQAALAKAGVSGAKAVVAGGGFGSGAAAADLVIRVASGPEFLFVELDELALGPAVEAALFGPLLLRFANPANGDHSGCEWPTRRPPMKVALLARPRRVATAQRP